MARRALLLLPVLAVVAYLFMRSGERSPDQPVRAQLSDAGSPPAARMKATPVPRLVRAVPAADGAVAAPVYDEGDEPTEPGYPSTISEGLAEDLRIMNAEQLQAELTSIALSYPSVIVVGAHCPKRPCRSEVRAANPSELDQFLQMVRNRFQGHVKVSRRAAKDAEGKPVTDVTIVVGPG